jgi:hypothetical protein
MKTLILWMAVIFTAVPALADTLSATATIKGFSLKSCVPAVCITVRSPRALQGNFGLMTLEQVEVQVARGSKVQIIEGTDALYDPSAHSLAIRHVTKGPAREVLVYMDSGRLQLF